MPPVRRCIHDGEPLTGLRIDAEVCGERCRGRVRRRRKKGLPPDYLPEGGRPGVPLDYELLKQAYTDSGIAKLLEEARARGDRLRSFSEMHEELTRARYEFLKDLMEEA